MVTSRTYMAPSPRSSKGNMPAYSSFFGRFMATLWAPESMCVRERGVGEYEGVGEREGWVSMRVCVRERGVGG